MKLLLDTHVFLWLKAAPERLGDVVDLVGDPDHELLLSAASGWEVAVKWSIGRLALPEAPRSYVPSRMAESRIAPLAVTHDHALAVADLPPYHRDPFDRLLVAQAIAESARLITADRQLEAYDVQLVLVGASS